VFNRTEIIVAAR